MPHPTFTLFWFGLGIRVPGNVYVSKSGTHLLCTGRCLTCAIFPNRRAHLGIPISSQKKLDDLAIGGPSKLPTQLGYLPEVVFSTLLGTCPSRVLTFIRLQGVYFKMQISSLPPPGMPGSRGLSAPREFAEPLESTQPLLLSAFQIYGDSSFLPSGAVSSSLSSWPVLSRQWWDNVFSLALILCMVLIQEVGGWDQPISQVRKLRLRDPQSSTSVKVL